MVQRYAIYVYCIMDNETDDGFYFSTVVTANSSYQATEIYRVKYSIGDKIPVVAKLCRNQNQNQDRANVGTVGTEKKR